jgi:hypothetical protein
MTELADTTTQDFEAVFDGVVTARAHLARAEARIPSLSSAIAAFSESMNALFQHGVADPPPIDVEAVNDDVIDVDYMWRPTWCRHHDSFMVYGDRMPYEIDGIPTSEPQLNYHPILQFIPDYYLAFDEEASLDSGAFQRLYRDEQSVDYLVDVAHPELAPAIPDEAELHSLY